MARFSFVGWDPAGTVALRNGRLYVTGALPAPSREMDPIAYLRRILNFYAVDETQAPFVGGLVGNVAFEGTAGHFHFGLYLDGIVYDHQQDKAWYVSRGEDRSRIIQAYVVGEDQWELPVISPLQPTVHEEAFEDRVERAISLIRHGEAYQISLARGYEAKCKGSLAALYDGVRNVSADPYLYHVRFANEQILGASPDMLMRVRGRNIFTFTVTATQHLPRIDPESESLLERTRRLEEHAMAVDLLRNDLYRVCRPGSLKVDSFRTVETYAQARHLVSRMRGELEWKIDALAAFQKLFPAGSSTGFPKERALHHIDQIEGLKVQPRDMAGGVVAYLSFNGDFDSALMSQGITIRDDQLKVHTLVEIHHDSEPGRAFRRTRKDVNRLLGVLTDLGAVAPPELV